MNEPRYLRWLRQRRRRWIAAVVLAATLVAFAAVSPLLLNRANIEVRSLASLRSTIVGDRQVGDGQTASQDPGGAETAGDVAGLPARGDRGAEREDRPAIPVEDSPAAAAYAAVAPELPGVEPEDVGRVSQSTEDPSWAAVNIDAPAAPDDEHYVVYTRRLQGGWKAERSVLPYQPDYPRKTEAPLLPVPGDLKEALYPEDSAPVESPQAKARTLASESPLLGEGWEAVSLQREGGYAKVRVQTGEGGYYTHAYLRRTDGAWSVAGIGRSLTAAGLPDFPDALVEPGSLPERGPAEIPPPEPVLSNVPEDRREEIEADLREVRETVKGYDGTIGLYVSRPGEEWGYGIRPDERFYSASVIKLPVLAAVYRKVEAGELSLSDTVATEDRDYAAGAGSLQWQEQSVTRSVEDYLWMMITESDNVATNVLVRTVGGPKYVNEVARDLGAEDTKLQHKVTDQRAAAPVLDNYTTPRDMAAITEAVATGEAANAEHTEQMMDLLAQNDHDSWLANGPPPEAEVAGKVGWIGGVYNEAALIRGGEEPYVISVFSKYGPPEVGKGSSTLAEISHEVWEIHDDGGEDPEEKTGEEERD